jgi:benzoyl-CoA reductase/2-hydroxyglutaryl-CoA dehydratase subunit BcrC/BadD/HgdB
MAGALETFRWHYENRSAEALAQHKAGVPVVGYTSNTVTWELIRAAGCFPVLLAPNPSALGAPTPHADQLMEPVFDSRIRAIFEEILAGAWSFLDLLVIPRTSEPEHKLYLYLREVERQKLSRAVPPLWLYDLLHTRTPLSRKYGLDRTKALVERLGQIGTITPKSLARAIAESNRARAALGKLQKLRTGGVPHVKGSDALAISGAFYFMDRAVFAKLAEAVCSKLGAGKPLRGPRLLIKGTPLCHPKLHQALEAAGALVTAEDDWWGSCAADAKIPPAKSMSAMVRAVFEDYYLHAPSPRVSPAAEADGWFHAAVKKGIDGVVFYLPPDDDVLDWDYPRQRDFLAARKIPSILIREDASRGLSAESQGQISEFVASAGKRSRRGSRD